MLALVVYAEISPPSGRLESTNEYTNGTKTDAPSAANE